MKLSKTYVYMCGVLMWPVILAESWYPHTCTHTHCYMCIYIYIYKLNTHTTQGLGAVLASRYGWDHQLGLSCHGVEWEKSRRWMHAINVISMYLKPTGDWNFHTFQTPLELWRNGEITLIHHAGYWHQMMLTPQITTTVCSCHPCRTVEPADQRMNKWCIVLVWQWNF